MSADQTTDESIKQPTVCRDPQDVSCRRPPIQNPQTSQVHHTTRDTPKTKISGVFTWMAPMLCVFAAFIIWQFTYQGPGIDQHELRLMLLGKTGSGKSASGNTILGEEAFRVEASPTSVFSQCEKRNKVVHGRNITIIDTPGFMDTWLTSDQTAHNAPECIHKLTLYPHVFLLVIRLARFTEEESNLVKWIQMKFGGEALRFTMILFTGGDQLKEKSVGDFISNSNELHKLVDICNGRYHVFNNYDKNNQTQVTHFIEKIQHMLYENVGYTYTKEVIQYANHKRVNELAYKLRDEQYENRKLKRDLEDSNRRLFFAICIIILLLVIALYLGSKILTKML